jgi:acetylornithine deacetylase/succinyl-diaminopimelate desuccinylase-like protein
VANNQQGAVAIEPNQMAVVPFLLTLFSFAVVLYFDVVALPVVALPRTNADFSVLNTRSHVEKLTKLGPRVVGAPVNEYTTPELLTSTLRAISPASGCALEIDVQHPSGRFRHDGFLGGFTSVYANLTNVVARLSWPATARPNAPALLINAHYDSSGAGPGSSDDGLGVASMLELARALAVGPPLGFAVVLLFDGAEETNQQGAHGFITQHKVSKKPT